MSELSNAIQEFKSAYDDLFNLAEYWPADRRTQSGACGVWSAREVLAHCSGWLVEVKRRYDGYDAGDTQKVQYDFDEFNARSVAAREGRSWDEIVRELHGHVDSLIARAQALPTEKIDDKRYWRWLAIMAEDCREHTVGLRAFLEAA
jgi:hypothetical protein